MRIPSNSPTVKQLHRLGRIHSDEATWWEWFKVLLLSESPITYYVPGTGTITVTYYKGKVYLIDEKREKQP